MASPGGSNFRKTPTTMANAVSKKYKMLRARPSPLKDYVRRRLILKLNPTATATGTESPEVCADADPTATALTGTESPEVCADVDPTATATGTESPEVCADADPTSVQCHCTSYLMSLLSKYMYAVKS